MELDFFDFSGLEDIIGSNSFLFLNFSRATGMNSKVFFGEFRFYGVTGGAVIQTESSCNNSSSIPFVSLHFLARLGIYRGGVGVLVFGFVSKCMQNIRPHLNHTPNLLI